jgi:hypothetical protein
LEQVAPVGKAAEPKAATAVILHLTHWLPSAVVAVADIPVLVKDLAAEVVAAAAIIFPEPKAAVLDHQFLIKATWVAEVPQALGELAAAAELAGLDFQIMVLTVPKC